MIQNIARNKRVNENEYKHKRPNRQNTCIARMQEGHSCIRSNLTEINSPNWRHRPAENDEGIKPHIPSTIDILALSQLLDAKMSSVERMSPLDLLKTNLTNLDPLTENYDLGFYLNYLNKWPSLFSTVKDRDAGIVGYSMLYSTYDC